MLKGPKKAGWAHGCCTFPFVPGSWGGRGPLRRLGAPLLPGTRLRPAAGGWHPWVRGWLWERGGSWSVCRGDPGPRPLPLARQRASRGQPSGTCGTWRAKPPDLGEGLALPRRGGDIGQRCPRTHSTGAPGWPGSRQPLGASSPCGDVTLRGIVTPRDIIPVWGIVTLWGCHPVKRHHHPKRHHPWMGHRHLAGMSPCEEASSPQETSSLDGTSSPCGDVTL